MAPKSALTDLRLRAAAAGEPPEGSGIEILARLELERRLLVEWAEETGLVIPAGPCLARIEDTHGEHHVYYDPVRERYFKITHGQELDSSGFALTVATNFTVGKKTQKYIAVPILREATPFEYLLRLQLFNITFQDSIEVEGVITETGKESIVISQRFINGKAATTAEVGDFMTKRAFGAVPGVTLGRGKSVSYFRASDAVAVFDTHGQNFLNSGSEIVPIDGLIIAAHEDLVTFLTLSPEERRQELGY